MTSDDGRVSSRHRVGKILGPAGESSCSCDGLVGSVCSSRNVCHLGLTLAAQQKSELTAASVHRNYFLIHHKTPREVCSGPVQLGLGFGFVF